MGTSGPNRINRILRGMTIGLIVPAITFLIIYQIKGAGQGVVNYLEMTWKMKIFLKIVSLCVLPNLGFFFFFLQLKYEMAARGVVMATFIYAFAVLIAKLV